MKQSCWRYSRSIFNEESENDVYFSEKKGFLKKGYRCAKARRKNRINLENFTPKKIKDFL